MTAPASELTLPASVREALDGFVAVTQRAFADHLRSIVLYGSAAESRLRATSDVNVLVVLEAFDPARAEALGEPLRLAQAAVALRAMFDGHTSARSHPHAFEPAGDSSRAEPTLRDDVR